VGYLENFQIPPDIVVKSHAMDLEVVIAPRSPWQNPYVERLIGSIRRECLNYVAVFHAQHLKRLLTGYFAYYHQWRTHLSLAMDCPEPRPVLSTDTEAE
jgi:transposase InsO family protein